MNVIFRVNNPEFGILHLNPADNPSIDLKSTPTTAMMPRTSPFGLLRSQGFKKGDLLEVEFDRQHQVTAIRRIDGALLWPI